ncbi:MAG TPA: nitroreductase family protein [Blastocatellia bacterium]|nr:nitroreductase family protein [Blastocatellia bacterium]
MNIVESEARSKQEELRQKDSPYPEKVAPVSCPISELIARRWSSRAFDAARPVEREKVRLLLEAARWAPSSFNEQPWRYLVFDSQDPPARERALACLMDFNAWARQAPVLMLSVTREIFAHNAQPNQHARHDLGMASENLVLEAVNQGLMAHQMAGFDVARARREFGIPPDCTPMAMIAIGYPFRGDPRDLPVALRAMETQPRQRRLLREIAFHGNWNKPYGE